ncbi:two-component regulator propeller domain-containing protein [Chitinophaga sp. CC14]|uniref:hybrid sensor histidine kinase/response regulator transcription factor n=1 Tax=Chitinophaga sp. CC14 TaxID=3029199 RepID=UPI003B7B74DD
MIYTNPRINIPVSVIYLFLAMLLTRSDAHAQQQPISHLGIERGLSNNSVTCIHKDRYGFMWFGTYDGLNRYDGYSFKVSRQQLKAPNSLTNNRIVTIAEDSSGYMWVGTKHGANRLNGPTGVFQPVYYRSLTKGDTLPVSSEVYTIVTNRKGLVLMGTASHGLLVYPPAGSLARQIPLTGANTIIANNVPAIVNDQQGRCWLIVQNVGLCRYDEEKQQIVRVNEQQKRGNCLIADASGQLWMGTDEGVYCYNPATNMLSRSLTATRQQDSKVISLTIDATRQLWVATDGDGIFVMPEHGDTAWQLQTGKDKSSLTSNAVYAVYEDRDQRKWIGTLRGGVNIIDKQKSRFTTITPNPLTGNSPAANFAFSFCEDGNKDIWIGTDGGGISIWNRKQNCYTAFAHKANSPGSLSNNNVTSIVKDQDNNIWVATFGGGINRYNRANHTFEKYTCSLNGYEDKFVWKLYLDSQNTLWAGACMGGTIYRLNKATNRFECFDPGLRDIITISEDKAGDLWFGTFNRLIKADTKNRQHQYYNMDFNVRAIYEDKAHHFWIGTEGGGLVQFDRATGKTTTIAEQEGLPNNAVLNIEEDNKGNLWMSTYNGIARYSPSTGQCKNFYESDGLQSNQFNYNASLRLSSGELLFGGIKGFNIFDPAAIAEKNDFPPLLIAGLRISNTPYDQEHVKSSHQPLCYLEELVLPYDKAVFSLDYVALEYSSPDKIAYAYYMEGWDNDWNYVNTQRTANYTRLHEGNYRFRIKSTNADGIWNPQERIIKIKVLPPWYRTWLAYIVYALLTGGLLYAYRFYQRRQARLRYEIELSHIRSEKEKEVHEKRLSFFTNVSHEFRTPLTLIINPVKELLYSDGRQIESKDLTIVYRNARRLLSLVDQLLLFRKADQEEDQLKIVPLDMAAICREVYLCFTHQAGMKKLQFDFSCNAEQVMAYADREKIEVALFNLLSNAFKYTPDGGSIHFSLSDLPEGIVISVADSGCGIPGQVGNKLFERFYQVSEKDTTLKNGFGIGLYLVKKFVQAHKGTVAYESEPGNGTTFTITLQKGKDHLHGYTVFEETAGMESLLEELVEEDDLALMEAEEAAAEDTLDVLLSPRPSMLIVDDNGQIRDYIKSIFKATFNIYEASEGGEGYQLASRHLPDIIISDVLMEGQSGIELCRQIKSDPALGHIPVVLLTASSSPEIKLKGIEGGADDYLSKPFDKDLFVARITNIIRSRNTLQQYFYKEITLNTGNQKISAEYKEFLHRCIAVTEKHLDNPDFNIKQFALEIGISHSTLYKKVKSISGHSVNEFIRFIRLRKAAELLINTGCNVSEAAFQVGFNDVKYFREQFCKVFEMNPSAYIRKYRKKFDNQKQV